MATSPNDPMMVPRWFLERLNAMLRAFEGTRPNRGGRGAAGGEGGAPHANPTELRLVTLYEAATTAGTYKAKEIWRKVDGSDWEVMPGGDVFDGGAGNFPVVRELAGRTGLAKALPAFAPALIELREWANGTLEWVFSAGGADIKWAKSVSVSGNNVTATPVADRNGTAITPTPANITVLAFSPPGTLTAATLPAGTVFAYVTAPGDTAAPNGVHLALAIPSLLPAGAARYMVLQLDGSLLAHFDWVRAH